MGVSVSLTRFTSRRMRGARYAMKGEAVRRARLRVGGRVASRFEAGGDQNAAAESSANGRLRLAPSTREPGDSRSHHGDSR